MADQQWLAAREEARAVLIRCAREARPIAYSALVQHVHAVQFDAWDSRLNKLLGELSESEDRAGRGMLSVLVVHKDGDMEPGPGFFELAKKLGRDTSDVFGCWLREYEVVTRYWRGH